MVDMFEVAGGRNARVDDGPDMFDYGDPALQVADDVGFAGFRVHAPVNRINYSTRSARSLARASFVRPRRARSTACWRRLCRRHRRTDTAAHPRACGMILLQMPELGDLARGRQTGIHQPRAGMAARRRARIDRKSVSDPRDRP